MPSALSVVPLLTTSAFGATPQFEVSDAFVDAVSQTDEQNIVMLAVVGEGRSGKSTFLNYVVGSLLLRRLVAIPGLCLSDSEVDVVLQPFLTGNTVDPVTRGVDVLLLTLTNGNILMLIDMEGLHNRERPVLDIILAIITRITDHMVFMDISLSDNFRDTLGRLVGSCLISSPDPKCITWPKIHVVLNLSRVCVDETTLMRIFCPGDGVSEETSMVRLSILHNKVATYIEVLVLCRN
jgi:hypothetical protein